MVKQGKTAQLREKIILLLQNYFEPKPHIHAYWLWGSDANNESDEYSDLDLFFCVEDGQESDFLSEAQELLTTIWPLDYIENTEFRDKKTGKIFHIKGTPESLLIEVYSLPQSKWMQFIEWHPAFKPKIIFDKGRVITFQPLDEVTLTKNIQAQLAEQKNLMNESGRAIKYIQRNEYIEATNYYIKYVFLPLVSILRIKHTPLLHDWLRIHISHHFPKDVIIKLEGLMHFWSLEDLQKNISKAREWFWEVVKDLET